MEGREAVVGRYYIREEMLFLLSNFLCDCQFPNNDMEIFYYLLRLGV